MALSVVFLAGVGAAVFVGVNIGRSSTGVAFGPATDGRRPIAGEDGEPLASGRTGRGGPE